MWAQVFGSGFAAPFRPRRSAENDPVGVSPGRSHFTPEHGSPAVSASGSESRDTAPPRSATTDEHANNVGARRHAGELSRRPGLAGVGCRRRGRGMRVRHGCYRCLQKYRMSHRSEIRRMVEGPCGCGLDPVLSPTTDLVKTALRRPRQFLDERALRAWKRDANVGQGLVPKGRNIWRE